MAASGSLEVVQLRKALVPRTRKEHTNSINNLVGEDQEGLCDELVTFTGRASAKSEVEVWETAGDGNLGFWFLSKCLTQMEMALKIRGQIQVLIKTNTKQHSDSSEEGQP